MIESYFKGMESDTKLVIFIVACVTVFLITKLLLGFIFKLFYGYPPVQPASATASKQECNHDDNLTGLCLRHDGCKTSDQCSSTVEGWHRPRQEE